MKLVRIILYLVGVLTWVILFDLSTRLKTVPIIDVSAIILAELGGGILLIIWLWYVSTIGKKDSFWMCDKCNQPQPMWNPENKEAIAYCPYCKGIMRYASK